MTFKDGKERAALYAEFRRNIDNPEAHDIPLEVQKMWRSAVASKSRTAKNNVFKAFLKSGKSWGRLLV